MERMREEKIIYSLYLHISNPKSLRVFFGLLVESDYNEDLKGVIKEHLKLVSDLFVTHSSLHFTKNQSVFLNDHIQGMAMTNFHDPRTKREASEQLDKLLKIVKYIK